MKISELMSSPVKTCRATDTLASVAQLMWDNDCGFVPVVDSQDVVIGTLTDRDICMAAYTQGKALSHIAVSTVAPHKVFTASQGDQLSVAEMVMRRNRVRRVPVVDGENHLVGVLALSDLARYLSTIGKGVSNGINAEGLGQTVAEITQARHALTLTASPSTGDSVRRVVPTKKSLNGVRATSSVSKD